MQPSDAPSDTKETPRPRTCGFQMSWTDVGIIVVCGIATWLFWSHLGQMALLFPVALGHFFLFCNIFRIYRKYEYTWAIVFVLNVLIWLFLKRFNWGSILVVQTPITIALILIQMRSPLYHGVGARIINKDIETYLRGENFD